MESQRLIETLLFRLPIIRLYPLRRYFHAADQDSLELVQDLNVALATVLHTRCDNQPVPFLGPRTRPAATTFHTCSGLLKSGIRATWELREEFSGTRN